MPANSPDFDKFYVEKIEPILPRLKQAQGKGRAWRAATVGAMCVTVLYGIGVYTNPSFGDGWVIFFLVCMVLVGFYQSVHNNDAYTDAHKTLVITEVINYVAPGVVFKPYKNVSSKAF